MNVVVDIPSWINAAIGGAMIGTAAACLFAFNGRIAGVSGVLGSLVFGPADRQTPWRSLFLGGLVIGALIVGLVRGNLGQVALETGWAGMIIGGLIVGFGTRLGGGCTSGHGVCGIGRLSQRSIVATCTFMAAGFATVYVLRHLVGGAS
tara:strand:- start:10795 stop:11241 length:447 start_codon:yes stop_codon:yes gene_type:complete